MQGNPSRALSKGGAQEGGGGGRHAAASSSSSTVDEEGGGDDLTALGCSGRQCKSCTAGLIADCVALCCCPCGLINFLTFAFVKVPFMVGRRCLGRARRRRREKRLEMMKRKCKRHEEGDQGGDGNYGRKGRVEGEFWEIIPGFGGGGGEEDEVVVEVGNGSARLEAERVWLEFYQVGHLGFGRVSYTGIQ